MRTLIFNKKYTNNISVDIHKKDPADIGLDYIFSVYNNGRLFTTRRGMRIEYFQEFLDFLERFIPKEFTHKKEIDFVFPIGKELYYEYDESMNKGFVIGYNVGENLISFKIKSKVGSIRNLYISDINKSWFYDKSAAKIYASSHHLYCDL